MLDREVRAVGTAVIALNIGLMGCGNGTAPVGEVGPVAVVGQLDRAEFVAVDLAARRVARYTEPVARFVWSAAPSPDSATFYVVGVLGPSVSGETELVRVDARTGRVIARESVDTISARYGAAGTVRVHGIGALGTTPDGSRLIAGATVNGNAGLVVIDLETRTPLTTVAPLFVSADLAVLPRGPAAAEGAVLAVGTRDVDASVSSPSQGILLVLDATGTTVVDSAVVTPPAASGGGIEQMIPARDGRYVYLGGPDKLYKYDLVARAVTATAEFPAGLRGIGPLAISHGGERLYLGDVGDGRDFPGSGLVYVFDGSLVRQPDIDLRTSPDESAGLSVQGIVVSRDDQTLYVTTGVPETGPLFSHPPAQLRVVDVLERRVVANVELGSYGRPRIVVVR